MRIEKLKIAHRITLECAIFHIKIFSDIITVLCHIIGKLGYIDRTTPDPRWASKNPCTTPKGEGRDFSDDPPRIWGVVRSMSSSFAFIIPLNYQINAKNNLSDRAENTGPYTFILPVVKTTCY